MVEDEELGVAQILIDLSQSSEYLVVRESAKGVLWTLSDLLHASKTYTEQGKIHYQDIYHILLLPVFLICCDIE